MRMHRRVLRNGLFVVAPILVRGFGAITLNLEVLDPHWPSPTFFFLDLHVLGIAAYRRVGPSWCPG
jgi:hypothetical protein